MDLQPKLEIVIVPSLGMGHAIPLIEFARLIVSRFSFTVTLLLPSTSHQHTQAQLSLLNSLPKSISYVFLDPVNLPDGLSLDATISLTMAHSLPSIRAILAQHPRVIAIVTDLYGSDLLGLGRELGIPSYVYFPSTAMGLLLALHLPNLDETVSCEYRDMPNPVTLPGCVPLHGKDFMDSAQDRKSEAYKVLLDQIKRYGLANGIFVNSFLDLEPGAIRALQTEDPNRPPIYPVGPIVKSGSGPEADGSECLKWLDQQPSGSVLFVSFGSGGTLSKEQLNELAIGLERSGQRFLWVVRSPNDESSSGAFFGVRGPHDQPSFLPEGFVNRIKDRGLLVSSWAPHIEILQHGSTGGFLTHCGWNSVVESIINGVPLIAWPLYAEQNLNAVLLNEGLKVALRPRFNEGGILQADDIAQVVYKLMEGDEGKNVRSTIKKFSDLAVKAISDNGDSTKTLGEIALKWIQTKI